MKKKNYAALGKAIYNLKDRIRLNKETSILLESIRDLEDMVIEIFYEEDKNFSEEKFRSYLHQFKKSRNPLEEM